MKRFGFTGTRGGMTVAQKRALKALFMMTEWDSVFHHGDCIGSDAEAHEIAQQFGLRIMIHPPDVDTYRAFCDGAESYRPKPYLDRNKEIVDACVTLIACPRMQGEERRSGTWSTIRYARKQKTRLIVIFPDGSLLIENLPRKVK